jgi:CheY-like chemotaxis protein/anti-sigma regulatory factor (Ser/Thr protein kinase)
VHGAGTAMKALVDDILDVAKMETGNLTIEQAPLELPALVRDVSLLWEEQARGRGLDFVLDVADAPAWISGDAARLRQILFNLLSNALKFTEHGTVALRVTHSGNRLAIAVRDSGIGIPAAKQELIFESFKQADGGTTRRYGGTGLGLAICRNLARAMGGDILIDSRDGEGATFTLDMPLVRLAPPAEPAPCSPDSDTPCGLLIVDRNPITRNMLKTVLESRAGTVRFAGSVDEAIAQIGDGNLSHVLIDEATIKAAGDVPAVLRRLRQKDEALHLAQLWTAPDAACRAALAQAGVDQVIAKPLAGAALAQALFPVAKNSIAEHLVTQAA